MARYILILSFSLLSLFSFSQSAVLCGVDTFTVSTDIITGRSATVSPAMTLALPDGVTAAISLYKGAGDGYPYMAVAVGGGLGCVRADTFADFGQQGGKPSKVLLTGDSNCKGVATFAMTKRNAKLLPALTAIRFTVDGSPVTLTLTAEEAARLEGWHRCLSN